MGYPPPPPGADEHEAARKEASPGCLFALLTLGVGPLLLRRGGA